MDEFTRRGEGVLKKKVFCAQNGKKERKKSLKN